MISCTAGPTQIQSNSLLAQHQTGMVWHAFGSDMSRQGRKGQATCVHRLCCHVWLKIGSRRAAKMQSREAWPTQSLERGLTSRRARRGVCSSCSLGTSWPAAGSLQGRRCPATSRELASCNSYRMAEARNRFWEAQYLNFAASFQMSQAEEIAFYSPGFRISTLYFCLTIEIQCHCPCNKRPVPSQWDIASKAVGSSYHVDQQHHKQKQVERSSSPLRPCPCDDLVPDFAGEA
jgi:hypothetical protein